MIVAAGRGERFGQPKQLIDVAGRPLVAWSIETFGAMPEVLDLAIAVEPENAQAVAGLAAFYAPRLVTRVVAGGATRQASVRNALAALPPRCAGVFVHDGARPLVTASDVRAGMRLVKPGVASLLAEPVVDTIKVVTHAEQQVTRTLDRQELWAAQTPQFALLRDMRRVHAEALKANVVASDDATLLERAGLDVFIVPSVGENFKVTRPGDRDRAEALLRTRPIGAFVDEEILLVEAFVKPAAVDAVSQELASRGTIDGIDRDLPRGAAIRAFVPAERLHGFGDRFADLAGGDAIFTTRHSHDVARPVGEA